MIQTDQMHVEADKGPDILRPRTPPSNRDGNHFITPKIGLKSLSLNADISLHSLLFEIDCFFFKLYTSERNARARSFQRSCHLEGI